MASSNKTSSIPLNVVFDMKENGFSPNQVIEELQRMGYGVDKIFDTMKLVENDYANPSIPMNVENFNTNMPPPPIQSQPQQEYSGFQQPSMSYGSSVTGMAREEVEEIAETIIQEKWSDLVQDIKKVIKWKEEMETRISKIEQQINNLKDNFTSLQKAIFGKINEYDKNIVVFYSFIAYLILKKYVLLNYQ